MHSNNNNIEINCNNTIKEETKLSSGKEKLNEWLNRLMKIEMFDGRTLIGIFLCTDRDANVILGSCTEYLPPYPEMEEPRMLGLVMIPGKHIVKTSVDINLHAGNMSTSTVLPIDKDDEDNENNT